MMKMNLLLHPPKICRNVEKIIQSLLFYVLKPVEMLQFVNCRKLPSSQCFLRFYGLKLGKRERRDVDA